MRLDKFEIMDVGDVDTRCIPETMSLCVERIMFILQRWLGFWFRAIGVPETFVSAVLLFLEVVQNIAHLVRYTIRFGIEFFLMDFERLLVKVIKGARQRQR